jgi:hypothetical protein
VTRHAPRRQRRDDQRRKHEVEADELHGHGDCDRKQHVKPDVPEARAHAEPQHEDRSAITFARLEIASTRCPQAVHWMGDVSYRPVADFRR